MSITADLQEHIARRLENSAIKELVAEELRGLLKDRPPEVPTEEYCATLAFLLVRQIGCLALSDRSGATPQEEPAVPHEMDFETILNGLLAAMQYDLIGSNVQMVRALGASVAERDTGTSEHSLRVTIYAVRIAEQAGFSLSDIQTLIKGSFLHDIGKIGIPDATLLKRGALSEDEYRLMKSHPIRGAHIIEGVIWLEDAYDLVLHHHEWWDGCGYPQRLGGEQINKTARIFAIADVFDALTSVRPYKEAYSYEKTMAIMEDRSGTHFQPCLFEHFRTISQSLLDRYGSNSMDELEKGIIQLLRRYFGLDPKGQYLRHRRNSE